MPHTLLDTGQEPVAKRKVGRPRKERPAVPETVPVDTGPLVGDRSAAGRIIGRSPSTVKRLEKSDPDWPVPFSVGGPACNNYFLDYVRQYALRKAARAAAARAAKAAAAQDAKGVASMQTSTPVFPQKDRAEQQPERGIRANQSRPAKTPAETA